MKKMIIPAVVAAVAFAANPVLAESAYLGAAFGQTKGDLDFGPAIVAAADTDDETSLAKYFLGFEVNRYFAIEGGYADFGTYSYTHNAARNNIDAKGIFLDAVGKLPIGSSFSLFGKVGVVRAGLKGDARDDTNGFKLGLGAEYLFSSNFAVRGEYEAISKLDFVDKSGATGSQLQLQMLSVGLIYRYDATLR